MKLFAKKSAPKSIAEFKASAAHIQQDEPSMPLPAAPCQAATLAAAV